MSGTVSHEPPRNNHGASEEIISFSRFILAGFVRKRSIPLLIASLFMAGVSIAVNAMIVTGRNKLLFSYSRIFRDAVTPSMTGMERSD